MFTLPAELTIANVDDCKSRLIELVDSHSEITLDSSAVTRVDTVGVQLLLATVAYAVSQNKALSWENQSSTLKQSIKLLGIEEPILAQYFTD